jgi:hypothetical protein
MRGAGREVGRAETAVLVDAVPQVLKTIVRPNRKNKERFRESPSLFVGKVHFISIFLLLP